MDPDFLKTIIDLLLILVGALLALFVFSQLSPALQLRVIPRRHNSGGIVLRCEIENKAKVRVKKQRVRLQVLEYPRSKKKSLSEWVPFSTDRILPTEEPIEWQDPAVIFKPTRYIFPGETMAIERLYMPSNKGVFLHVGLQFVSSSLFPWLRFRLLGHAESWTTTLFVDETV